MLMNKTRSKRNHSWCKNAKTWGKKSKTRWRDSVHFFQCHSTFKTRRSHAFIDFFWHKFDLVVSGISGINVCEKSWEHITGKNGQKFALLNIGNLPAISWISLTNVGHAGCYIGNLLEEDLWDVQQWIGRPNLNNFLDWSIGVIGRRWLQMLTGGWWRRTISSNFVHSSRIRLTGCLYPRTFCPGSRPKVGCLFGMRTQTQTWWDMTGLYAISQVCTWERIGPATKKNIFTSASVCMLLVHMFGCPMRSHTRTLPRFS